MKNLFFYILFLTGSYLLSAQEQAAGRMAGELAVTPSGAAVYTVPLMVPPGIGEAVPSLALTYNSQGGDGIAGWGWNLAGLSTISRVGATLHHDGVIDPVDFDELDRFALDGQRLLLKDPNATYGAENSEYQTENYSNLKIISQGSISINGGTAPRSFIVYYPDGSRAWYGLGNSFGQLEWAISRWEDPQGNRVDYSYTTQGGVLQIDTIAYGAQSKGAHPNTITFTYEEKQQRKINYIKGKIFYRNQLLKGLTITQNAVSYREYELTHNLNASGYERLSQIVEMNAEGNSKPPIDFSYRPTPTAVDSSDGVEDIGNFNSFGERLKGTFSFDREKHQLIPGDFNGDGYQDMIIRDGGLYRIVYSASNGLRSLSSATPINLPPGSRLHSFVAGHFQDTDNRVVPQQGFVSISQKLLPKENVNHYPGATSEFSQTQFTTYAVDPKTGDIRSYTKSWDNYSYNHEYNACGEGKVDLIDKSYYPADFTGDGLSDILMVENAYPSKKCPSTSPSGAYCDCREQQTYYRRLFLVDMDRNKTEHFVDPIGELTLKASDYIQLADFDGDGIPDLWHFFQGGVSVYNLYGGALKKLTTFSESTVFDTPKHTLIGDFNGDGMSDLMVPFKAGFDNWNLLTSTGTGFKWDHLAQTEITYSLPEKEDQSNYYLARDVDGDGVSDIVTFEQDKDEAHFRVYQNRATAEGWRRSFNEIHHSKYTDLKGKGAPLRFDVHQNNFNPIFVYLDGDKVYQKVLPIKHREQMQLNVVSHRGRTETILYQALGTDNTYYKAQDLAYPFTHINHALTLPLVKKVTTQAAGLTTNQDFKYYGAVSHVRGVGFVGFLGVARTNAYGVNTPSRWSISRYDPKLRGAVTDSWQPEQNPFYLRAQAFEVPTRGFSQKTSTQYTAETLVNGVFVATVDNLKSEDALNGFTTYVSYEYDSFFNPTKILTERDGGKTLQRFSYSNDITANSSGYHIGRVTQEQTTQSWEGKEHSTTVDFAYQNQLLQSRKIQGDRTETLTESYDYDRYGNLTERSRSAPGLPTRTESFGYTEDGRFLDSQTDRSGRTASFTYYPDGSLESETDVLGRTTTYGYDSWQRATQVTDYLGNTHQTKYQWQDNVLVAQNQNADGSESQTWTDAWGRTLAQGRLSLDGKWSWVSYHYDAGGRVLKESEPYLADRPSGGSRFTTTLYDAYGRIRSQKQSNGKTLQTTYTKGKPTATVNDGYQKVTTTLDARGNIAQLTDPNGTIDYSYHPNGQLETSDYQGHKVVVSYDGWGRKQSLNDPSVGEFTYKYDTYGQLLEESSPKGATTYEYTDDGLVAKMTQIGDHTHLSTAYDYDTTTRLPLTQTTTDGERRLSYSYGTTYDEYARPQIRSEQNSYARFSQILTYDVYGRPSTDKRTATLSGGASQEMELQHHYASNGMLTALKENNQTLWELKAENARGQATEVLLGNGITKKRTYDALGYLDALNDGNALNLSYSYNKKQGVLNSRTRTGIGQESFQHDQRNRLTRIQKGTEVLEQKYDDYGRLADNPKRGEYHYNAAKRYAMDSLILNASGLKYYKEHPRQDALYNIDRKAVSIHEHGFGRADFAYNAQMQRTHAWYGGEEENLHSRTYQKHYSSLFPAEITHNNETGKTDIVLYIGGDGYTAPAAKINNEVHYLHRDYLGSILAITNSAGTVVEERQFGAWGEIDFIKINGEESSFEDSILPRGFTGHEHFSEIALIHMNGRMYDPQLRRFLSPDNNIVDPFDSKSFDRFAYVFNSPLGYVDINGEDPLSYLIALGIAYIVSGIAHLIDTGRWEWDPSKRHFPTGIGVRGNFEDLLSNGGSGSNSFLNGFNGSELESGNISVNPANFSNTNSGYGSLSQEMNNNSETTTTGPCDIFTSPENCHQFGNNENNTESNQENVVITVVTSVQNPNPVGGGGNSDGEEENPCNQIKKQLEDAGFKEKIDELKQKTGLRKESGYVEDLAGNYLNLTNTNGGHTLIIPNNLNNKGYMHTHLNEFEDGVDENGRIKIKKPIKMFSPQDVISLLAMAKRTLYSEVSVKEVYGVMVSSGGNYTIRFRGNPAEIPNTFLSKQELRKEFVKYFEERYRNNKEKAFLKFVKEIMNVEGVSLFKIQNNGTIKEKQLDDNGRLQTLPCE